MKKRYHKKDNNAWMNEAPSIPECIICGAIFKNKRQELLHLDSGIFSSIFKMLKWEFLRIRGNADPNPILLKMAVE